MPVSRSLETLGAIRSRSLARARRRDVAAFMVKRADALAPDERALILTVYGEGRSVLEATRRQDANPATLPLRAAAERRRVRRLARRMTNPAFDLVRTRSNTWPPAMARIGRACFIEGLSMREASIRLRLSVYTVRSHMQAIRAMAASTILLAPAAEAAA